MNTLKEITQILDTHCSNCKVKSIITSEHGWTFKDRYCNEICKTGKKLFKLSTELENGTPIRRGKDLTQELYEMHKREGLFDNEICKKYKIGKTTLNRRKRHWGIVLPNQRIDVLGKTKQDYLELKIKDYSDKDICAAWKVGWNTLMRWKRTQNLRGGL